MSGQIFISYRRDDSSGSTGRLCDRFRAHFGRDNLFMDVYTIQPGVDFLEAIEKSVVSCEVLIAVIGNRWLTLSDRGGRRRLDIPEDIVRLEIATALKRGIRVVPVLVDGARMPEISKLPDGLKPLVRRNAVEINHHRFDADLKHLLTAVERALTAIEQRYESRLRKSKIDVRTLMRMDKIGYALTGANFVSRSRLREHFQRQPAGYACWESIPDAQICAFYVFLPLTKRATEKFLLATAQSAMEIRSGHLCRRIRNANSLYLNEIYGQAFPWRGVIINKLRNQIQDLATNSPKLKYLLARPVTPEGFKLVKSQGFGSDSSASAFRVSS